MSRDLLPGVTGILALADGTILQGIGVGAVGDAVGEVCFNTAMTGYQEILTDPSYMAQIVAFTFPHVGNVGTNLEDVEQMSGAAETASSNSTWCGRRCCCLNRWRQTLCAIVISQFWGFSGRSPFWNARYAFMNVVWVTSSASALSPSTAYA